MKSIKILFFSVFIVLLFGAFSPNNIQDQTLVIIVHKDNPVESLSLSEVKLYWLRKVKKRWPTINKNIRPVDSKSKSPEQQAFYKKVLNMSATDVEAYFNQKQYESAEKPQDKFGNERDIIEFVADQEGAIGFVNSNSLSADMKSKIKIVAKIE
ncbi:MAG: hypothetical protein EAZ53_05095 [Bacteroidetes bacterium]|nr:MAG: hypothetical protein EAZ53_05095 [Bacteroidota bacterium]